jgi:sortase (surface protein transpeptidase)
MTAGPVPGDPGPAVIAGHVDSRAGPAVFFRLRELRPGDKVTVRRSDGRAVAFTVDEVDRYPKDAFPTSAVYGPAPGSELRLITCGGSFDAAKRSYRDNVVVYASTTWATP